MSTLIRPEHDNQDQFHWMDQTTGLHTRVHPLVASGAREMLNKSEGERTSIVSTALTFLKLYRDPIIARNTRSSDFSIRDLIFNAQPVDLYLGIPPSDIARVMPLMRLVLNQILSRLTESMDFTQGTNGTADRHPLLLMLDEFPQFGRLPFFEKALAYIAGYGIRAFLISQDLTQLYAEYGQQQSIIANCHVRTAYAPNTLETAEHLSQYLGSTTVRKQNISYSGNRFDFMLKHKVVAEQEAKRPLLTADELLRLEAHRAVVFRAGHYPIDGKKIIYYEDPTFSQRSKIPAPACSDRLPATHPWQMVIAPTTPMVSINTTDIHASAAEEIFSMESDHQAANAQTENDMQHDDTENLI